ncbi:hypothetical protein JMJ35_000929 [Cladonia borealis]|uniref:Rhodopsin domain-containing protein n=1 Tax=Cladonia borealis TaxID=184061 RepID=A0AA39UE86_9LECA|nr:hypothetical protein JMJ35_000929 [Cladonia borealis]
MSSVEDYPLEPPPHGQISNFKDPKSLGPAAVVLCSVFLSLMWPIFLLRIYSKIWIIRGFGWDDAFSIIAVVGTTASGSGIIWLTSRVLGPHAWDVRAVEYTAKVNKMSLWDGAIVYNVAMCFAKLAIFILYFRLYSIHRRTRIAIYIGIMVNCISYTSQILVYLILCGAGFAARCRHTLKMNYAVGLFAVTSDIYLFMIPLPVLWGLQMSLRRKLELMAVFLTGFMAIMASSIGLYYRIKTAIEFDITYYNAIILGFNIAELALGVICSSAPYLPAFFRRHPLQISRVTHWLYRPVTEYGAEGRKSHSIPLRDIGGSNQKTSLVQKVQADTGVSRFSQGDFFQSEDLSVLGNDRSSTRCMANANSSDYASPSRRDYYEMAVPKPTAATYPVYDYRTSTS